MGRGGVFAWKSVHFDLITLKRMHKALQQSTSAGDSGDTCNLECWQNLVKIISDFRKAILESRYTFLALVCFS